MGVKWLQNAVDMITECQFNRLINIWREGNWSFRRSIDKIKWNREDWRKDVWSSAFYAFSSRPSSFLYSSAQPGKKRHAMKYKRFNEASHCCVGTRTRTNEPRLSLFTALSLRRSSHPRSLRRCGKRPKRQMVSEELLLSAALGHSVIQLASQ